MKSIAASIIKGLQEAVDYTNGKTTGAIIHGEWLQNFKSLRSSADSSDKSILRHSGQANPNLNSEN
ncbi:hypothetical protein [Endozoicomonas euniceicola]|uniref:Uncharacterized protein n=1 Tax=Endozoicomonas euniceicola TaxID=1234143 RepID=A0ABY6GPK7_9GAMM|nr:hypothetical protein [Endozoicomonas euniceicola]UYM14691.1 hypothetical protein NX720_17595 [Endozoicomonas euniceicola]